MKLEGSCHCGKVKFSVQSDYPYPFNLCYCSICRKTNGGGGFAINLGGDFKTMNVQGEEYINVYKARTLNAKTGQMEDNKSLRNFCKECGSALWIWDARWPELVHPFASAIDTPLPVSPECTHLMLEFKAPWVAVQMGSKDQKFDVYPKESIAEWHRRLGLEDRQGQN